MKFASLVLACAVCALPLAASAQWQWVDKDGRKVFSDQAPPNDIPDKNILRRPQGRLGSPAPAPAPVAAAAPAATAASAPAGPRLSGVDKDLQDRAQQAKDAEAAKAKLEADKQAKARADNCVRAREAKALLDSGTRMARTNSKGEREILDDAGRAAEARRVQESIKSDCSPAS